LLFLVPAYLDHITWSCSRTPVMHTIWLHYMYSGLHLTTQNSHVQILESGPWWSFCSWSECAADPLMVIGVQQNLGHWCSSSSQLFSCLAPEVLLLLVRTSVFVYLFMCYKLLYFLMMKYSCIIISLSVITMYLCYFYWNVYYHCASTSDSYLYWCLAYIREGISDLRIYVAVTSPYPPDRGVTTLSKTRKLHLKVY